MIRIKFNDQKSFRDATFTMLSDSSVMLKGEKLKSNDSGFKAFRLNGEFLGDYSDFTQCTEEGDGFIFSKV